MPSFALIFEADRLRLDGDAALALDVHRVEHLLDHVALGDGAGRLDQPVGERRFAMVDMGDDGEIADIVDGMGRHACEIAGGGCEEKATCRFARPNAISPQARK